MKKLTIMLTFCMAFSFNIAKSDKSIPKPITNYLVEVVVRPPFTMDFFEKQRAVESGHDQNAVSPVGAMGIAQFMPSTWKYLKSINLLPKYFDINNAKHQKTAQIKYMNYLYYILRDDYPNAKELTIASYNAGIGRVTNIVQLHDKAWKANLPLETKNYLIKLKQ